MQPQTVLTGATRGDALARALWPMSPEKITDLLVSGPGCWGPLQWRTLHLLAFWYPVSNPTPQQQDAFIAYVRALVWLLPCPRCQRHWAEAVASDATLRAATAGQQTLLLWTIDAHNAVNARLHKPVLSYQQAFEAVTGADAAATSTAVWGPLQWKALHQLTRGYPRTDPSPAHKAALVNYVQALVHLLPCQKCREHWAEAAATVGDATHSRYTAMKWAIDTHNAVNARLHKPQLSYAQAVRAIQTACPGDGTTVGAGPGGRTEPGGIASAAAGMPAWEAGVIAAGVFVVVAVAAIVTGVFMARRRKQNRV
jgi:hypothetical protein